MGSFLHIETGSFGVLLDAESIYEVLGDKDDQFDEQNSASGYYRWRGKSLLVVNCRKLFELKENSKESKSKGVGVVYAPYDDGTPLILEIERVVCLEPVAEDDFLPLSGVPEKAKLFFDKVFLKEGLHLFRLRRPLPVASFLLGC